MLPENVRELVEPGAVAFPRPAPAQIGQSSSSRWTRHTAWLLSGLLHLCFTPGAGAADSIRRDAVVQAVEKAMPSVVNIATETLEPAGDAFDQLFREFFGPYYRHRSPNAQHSLGSGVIVDEEGFILTNYHVVARAGRIVVKLADGREFEAERVAGTTLTDLALLKLKAPGDARFTAIEFAADDDLYLGETVLALGNPFGLGGSVSRGILSSKSRRPPREQEPMDVPDWLQTDAAINPGNSGGPLINLEGQLIGINVAIYREAEGIGFAIPAKRISNALAEIYSPEVLADLWFGARVKPGYPPWRVVAVEAESPAAQAGLRAEDRIVEINGRQPHGFIQLQQALLRAQDERIDLKIERDGRTRTLKLRLVPERSFFNEELIRRKTGASLQVPSAQLLGRLQLPPREGMVVAGVDPDSPAEKVGLAPGMLVTELSQMPMTDVVDAARYLYRLSKGDPVRLTVIVPRQRGPFLQYHEVRVELKVR